MVRIAQEKSKIGLLDEPEAAAVDLGPIGWFA